MSALGPGCVKTCTSRECAELFSLFSSFDGDCQSGSFVIQRNRDKLSTRKFDVGVFTQPGSKSGPHCPENRLPILPQQRTSRVRAAASEKCQQPTFDISSSFASRNHVAHAVVNCPIVLA